MNSTEFCLFASGNMKPKKFIRLGWKAAEKTGVLETEDTPFFVELARLIHKHEPDVQFSREYRRELRAKRKQPL